VNILAAILLIGASGHAERSVTVEDQQIAGVVARVIGGALGDGFAFGRKRERGISGLVPRELLESVTLSIDGEQRTGWRAWCEGVARVGAYAADCRTDGSVGYSYRLRVRGYDIRRYTGIANDHVVLTTDAWWVETVPVGRSTRRIQIHVTIRITAVEAGGVTRLVGTAVGTANLDAFRCGLIRKIAERQAAATLDRELDRCLMGIERTGTRLYLGSADIGPVLDGIGEAMRTVGPRIGSLRR
jgi:hypothetical protein